ncbi:hypothetical protein N7535_004514 [Penicillium sp. DV-2018c]|nr:hypothetical protein N7535_004514 [Penicillium sp. DV-2018c]
MSQTTIINAVREPESSLDVKEQIEVDFTPKEHYGDWRDEFHRNGCIILRNVITSERAKYYADKQIEWLKNFELGFDENDESTWTAEHLPVSFRGGKYYYGVAHEKSVWEARTEPGVMDAFAKLWQTEELLCSFDGIKIDLPRRKDVKYSPWPHCDHNPDIKGLTCVQGMLNFAPSGPKDGGLIWMKGSAKVFNEFFAQKRNNEDADSFQHKHQEFFKFHDDHIKWFEDKGFEFTKLILGPGDLALWDSRTVHHSCFAEGDQIRHAQYICMMPKRFSSEEALEMKRYCFENYMPNTHLPHRNIYPATDKPIRNGTLCPKDRSEPFEKPVLTDAVLKLAGVEPY